MNDEILRTTAFSGSRAANLYARTAEEITVPSPVWAAMGDEFRNQVTRLVAGTVQLREGLPRDAASEFAPALADMEASLDSLASLAKCLDAVVKPGEQVISDLGDVIERALALARPWLHSEMRISVSGRSGAVRNRTGAVECALAAMLVSLARSPDLETGRAARELRIEVFSGRGTLAVEIESDGGRPTSSWRWSLAERLADVVGGTLELLPDRIGASLRFQ